MDNPAARFYVETRFAADPAQVGSRWTHVADSEDPFGADEIRQRARFEALRTRTDLDARLVRLDWDPNGDEDSMPLTTIVRESTGAS